MSIAARIDFVVARRSPADNELSIVPDGGSQHEAGTRLVAAAEPEIDAIQDRPAEAIARELAQLTRRSCPIQ